MGQNTSVPWRPLGDTGVHFWLLQRMAKTCGADMVEASEHGDLNAEGWSEMVQRCRSCDWAEGCDRWLDQHNNGEAKAVPPKGCVNAEVLTQLIERQIP